MKNKNVKLRSMSEILNDSPVLYTQRQHMHTKSNIQNITAFTYDYNMSEILSRTLNRNMETFRINMSNIDVKKLMFEPYSELKRDINSFTNNYLKGLKVEENIKKSIKEAINNARINMEFKNDHEEIIQMPRPKIYAFDTVVTENKNIDNKLKLSEYVDVKGTIRDFSSSVYNISTKYGGHAMHYMSIDMISQSYINYSYILIMSIIIITIFSASAGKNLKD